MRRRLHATATFSNTEVTSIILVPIFTGHFAMGIGGILLIFFSDYQNIFHLLHIEKGKYKKKNCHKLKKLTP